MEVAYPTLASTEKYQYEPIDYNPIIPFDQGTPLVASMDTGGGITDKFSELIPIGFDFCFYDQTFSNLVISDNGIISFDQYRASQGGVPFAIPNENPHPSLITNAIFAVQQDMNFEVSQNSEIYYQIIGEAPCRKFVINYYEGNIFQCSEKITTQIVLHETTNEIDIHIKQKPLACDNGRNNLALLGIMNNDGSQGISPAQRNTGSWEAYKESYKFSPTGDRQPIIKWTNEQGNTVGSGKIIQVCSMDDNTYTAEVKYQNCAGSSFILLDDIQVQYDALYPSVDKHEFNVCDDNSNGHENILLSNYNNQILQDNSNFTFTYFLSEDAAINQSNPTQSINLTTNQTVFVRIENKTNPACYIIQEVTFNFASAQISIQPIEVCDNGSDDSEIDVNIVSHIKSSLTLGSYLSFTVHQSEDDAINKQNVITTTDITSSSQFWINMKFFEGCETVIGPIGVNFKDAPENRPTQLIELSLCDYNFDGTEDFNWDTEIRNVMTFLPDETFTVHKTEYQAKNNKNPQSEIEVRDSYFIRIQNPNGCFTVIEQPVDITFKGINANNFTKYICFDGIEDIAIDLDDYISEMNVSVQGYNNPLTDVAITYYKNEEQAYNNTNVIAANQVIADNGYKIKKTYYVRFQLPSGCFSIRTIVINLIHPTPQQDPVLVCDIFNDGIELNNLSSYDDVILGDQIGTVQYFKTLEDAQNSENELNTYDFSETQTLFVLISSHGCEKIYALNFDMNSVAEVQDVEVTLGKLCDNNNDDSTDINLTSFNKKVYAGNDATFKYYLSYDEVTKTLSEPIPALYNHTGNTSLTFYVDINIDNEFCNTIAKVTVHFDENKIFAIEDKERSACDFEGDLNEEFDLKEIYDEYMDSFTEFDVNNIVLSFHRTMNKAVSNQSPIPVEPFTPNAAKYTVYVRAHHIITGCIEIKELTLYTYSPPKAIDADLAVCDTNFDGNYDVMLTELNHAVMYETEGYNFSYYESEQNAINSSNPIETDEVLELSSLISKIWVRVERESLGYCYDVKSVSFIFKATVLLPIQDYIVDACDSDDDGLATMDLTTIENKFSPNQYTYSYYESLQDIKDRKTPIENPASYTNTTPYKETIYLMVHEEGYCSNYVEVDLIYHQIKASVKDVRFCPGESISIVPDVADDNDANNPKYTYEWYDESGALISTERILTEVTEEHTFTLKVIDKSYPVCYKELKVEASHYDVPIIVDILEENNHVTVIANGHSQIEYSLDGDEWQDSNIFYNLEHGVYTFWVRYVEGECSGESKEFVVLFLQSVITPNGDGINDKFIVKNLEVFGDELSSLLIFDRYGKVIYQTQGNVELIWNGTSLGRNVVTSDYWYIIVLPDGREKTGHISVKNQFNQE